MGIDIILTDLAPKAIGPYSQGAIFNNFIFTSGQIPITNDGKLIESNIEKQTMQVLENIKNILDQSGSSLASVIKTTVFLTDMDNFDVMNKVYEAYFSSHKPARSTICVKQLPKNSLVEIECVAIRNNF